MVGLNEREIKIPRRAAKRKCNCEKALYSPGGTSVHCGEGQHGHGEGLSSDTSENWQRKDGVWMRLRTRSS